MEQTAIATPQAGPELAQRFRSAYQRKSPVKRSSIRVKYMKKFGVSYGTFRKKLAGVYPIFEDEVMFLEAA